MLLKGNHIAFCERDVPGVRRLLSKPHPPHSSCIPPSCHPYTSPTPPYSLALPGCGCDQAKHHGLSKQAAQQSSDSTRSTSPMPYTIPYGIDSKQCNSSLLYSQNSTSLINLKGVFNEQLIVITCRAISHLSEEEGITE